MQRLTAIQEEVHVCDGEQLLGRAMLIWEELPYAKAMKCMAQSAEASLPTATRYTLHLKHISGNDWDIRWRSLPQTYARLAGWAEGIVKHFPPPSETPTDLYGYAVVGYCTTPAVRRIFHMGDPAQAAQWRDRFAGAAAAGE